MTGINLSRRSGASRIARVALAGVAFAALAGGANAATFIFSGGNYVPGTTAPEPLTAPDVLEISGGANKNFNAVTFTNQSGLVNWTGGAIVMTNNAQIINQSMWDSQTDNQIINGGGALSSFNNSGTFRKSAGAGTTTIGSIAFVNSGIIEALVGTINFSGTQATFNEGSIFSGDGITSVNSNSAFFNGGFSSENVVLASGTFTGNGAELSGTVAMSGGTMTGGWAIESGSLLSLTSGANKSFNALTLTNEGEIGWQSGALVFTNGTTWTNNGLIDASVDNQIINGGGAAPTINNLGTFLKSAGEGTTTIGGLTFVNSGTVQANSGTINFANTIASFNDGTIFAGDGVISVNSNNATFSGGFTSENLLLGSGTFIGDNATLGGSVSLSSGTMTGGWSIEDGSSLTLLGGANKGFDDLDLTNDGAIYWQVGALVLTNGATFTNIGLIETQTNNSIINGGGGTQTINNLGTFLKSAGEGTTTVGTINFANSGIVEASVGTINFGGTSATFNDGSIFRGDGVVAVNSNAAVFNGGFTSENLVLASGTFAGNDAVLGGEVAFNSGTLTGGWSIAEGATLTVQAGANKGLNALSLLNGGTIVWAEGALVLTNGTSITNDGTIDIRTNNQVINGGGAAQNFVNNGTIVKTAGAGTTTIPGNVGFDNEGVIDVQVGTIALPTNFINDGTLAGTGTFLASGTLTNAGVVGPGSSGAGELTIDANYLQALDGILDIQLVSSSLADLLTIDGTASLGGSLALSCLSCSLNDGDIFTILASSGTLNGSFANVSATGFLDGFDYDVIYDYAQNFVQVRINDAGMAPTAPAVPEPQSWAMMLMGFGVIGYAMRRRHDMPGRQAQAV
jgi:hypothetical protein